MPDIQHRLTWAFFCWIDEIYLREIVTVEIWVDRSVGHVGCCCFMWNGKLRTFSICLIFFSLCSHSDVLELIYDSGRHDDIMAGNGNEYVFQPIWELERRKIFIQLAYGLSGIFKYIIVYLPELQDEHVWKLDIFECSWNSLRKWYANVENSYIRIELSAED